VISDESYEKINLQRDQLVQAPQADDNVNAPPQNPTFGTPGGLGGAGLNNLQNLIPQLDKPKTKPAPTTEEPPKESKPEPEKAEPAAEESTESPAEEKPASPENEEQTPESN